MHNTLFVVDNDTTITNNLEVISFNQYLRDYPKLGEPKTRVINLCDTERYLSQGYYCSLLAEARTHHVLPSVKTINRLRDDGVYLWFDDIKLPSTEHEQTIVICMGQALDDAYQSLAIRVYRELPTPLLIAKVSASGKGIKVNVTRVALNQLDAEQYQKCIQILTQTMATTWRKRAGQKRYRWDLAILVNESETVPPSNKGALARFVKAASKLGIRAQLVNHGDLVQLSQFDGLFIRETTAINHHTYQLAHRAEQLGLVVMDDADSILRCCNKVFLHDAFNYQKVPSLKTQFVTDANESTLDQLEQAFSYPIILKMPEGSFSRGVFKANSRTELKSLLDDLLTDSALVLAQEYLYTDFDWRIGVLNGRALYACRYYMARNHWQIYNHGSSRFFSGGFDAMATFEVPRRVLQAALKAASVVGTGLYGIDVKEVDGRAYVLEVNDNPSLDHGVEDHYLGEELYMQIMAEFLRRMELRGQKS